MTAPLFFVDSLEPGEIRLSPADGRHALRALRLKPGEPVTVADGAGLVGTGRLADREGDQAVIEVSDVHRVARRGTLVSVSLAPPKGDRLSWAVQKLAELGVDEIVLVPTERSVRAWDGDRAGHALERQRAVAREAAMQSRRPFVAEVAVAGSLDDVLAPGPSLVLLWEGADAPLHETLPGETPALRLLVGPEGSFTEAELDRAVAAGAVPASLGPGILRTETAAVVGAALVLAWYGRLG
jgi:16S rRNA (uracil1498-N3)-methyltransferase